MFKGSYTTKISSSTLASVFTVESGLPIAVNGILISATALSTITVLRGDGVTTLFQVRLAANSTLSIPIEFLAAHGIAFSGLSTDTVTVFHSNAGA